MVEPGQVVTIKLRSSVAALLKQRRDALGITVSDQIRLALELWIEKSTEDQVRLVPPREKSNDPTLEILRTASVQLSEFAKTIARIEKVRKRPLRRKPSKDTKPSGDTGACAAKESVTHTD